MFDTWICTCELPRRRSSVEAQWLRNAGSERCARRPIGDNTWIVVERAAAAGSTPRAVADEMALARVRDTMSYGRSFPA